MYSIIPDTVTSDAKYHILQFLKPKDALNFSVVSNIDNKKMCRWYFPVIKERMKQHKRLKTFNGVKTSMYNIQAALDSMCSICGKKCLGKFDEAYNLYAHIKCIRKLLRMTTTDLQRNHGITIDDLPENFPVKKYKCTSYRLLNDDAVYYFKTIIKDGKGFIPEEYTFEGLKKRKRYQSIMTSEKTSMEQDAFNIRKMKREVTRRNSEIKQSLLLIERMENYLFKNQHHESSLRHNIKGMENNKEKVVELKKRIKLAINKQ